MGIINRILKYTNSINSVKFYLKYIKNKIIIKKKKIQTINFIKLFIS